VKIDLNESETKKRYLNSWRHARLSLIATAMGEQSRQTPVS
jgi:hypothetical protein